MIKVSRGFWGHQSQLNVDLDLILVILGAALHSGFIQPSAHTTSGLRVYLTSRLDVWGEHLVGPPPRC